MAVENRSELQDVSANRIADFNLSGCAREFTSVARVLEMVEQSIAEHMEKYRMASDQCPATSEKWPALGWRKRKYS